MHTTAALNGASMGWPWALPFLGILLSIATGPLLFGGIWHRHYGKIVGGWAVATIVSLSSAYGLNVALTAAVHAMVGEYLSFIVTLFTLYTVAGGILITGNVGGNPIANTAVLGLGYFAAFRPGAFFVLRAPLTRQFYALLRASSLARSPSITGFAISLTPGIARTLLNNSSMEGRAVQRAQRTRSFRRRGVYRQGREACQTPSLPSPTAGARL